MDLHSGRDAQRRDPQPDRVVDVAGGAVATGEEHQVHRGALHLEGGPPSVAGRGLAGGDGAYHRRGQAAFTGLVLAHLAGEGDQLDGIAGLGHDAQRVYGPFRRLGDGAALPGFPYGLGAVTTLEADAAADAGDGVDDQAQLFHRDTTRTGCRRSGSRRRP